MGKTKDEIADLGPIGIIREALRIFRNNTRHFLLIQLTLGLPATILGVGLNLILYRLTPKEAPPTPPSAGVDATSMRSIGGHFGGLATLESAIPIQLVVVSILGGITFQAIGALSGSASMLSVGLVYSGKSVSFLEVFKAAIPGLWAHLVVTGLYVQLLMVGTSFLSLVSVQITLQFSPNPLLVLIAVLVFTTLTFYIAIIFWVAAVVSILEEDYGWAALRKGKKLIRGKLWIIILIQLILLVPKGPVLVLLQKIVRLQFMEHTWTNAAVFVLAVIVEIACSTLLSQLSALCAGVSYVSFKAYHSENIPSSRFFTDLTTAGYQRLGSKIEEMDDAFAESHEADNPV